MSLFSKKAYVGLDIGHHALKAVQVERTPTGWHIARSISAPTPADTVRDGVVIDPVLLGLAIKNMLKAGHIHATSAAIAISGGTVVVRPVRMPKMAESSLRKSIRFEASRYVPNSVEDSYIEFEIIGDADATNMDVIIAAAPKELVDSRIQACENAGLEVEHVEVATFAAYRAVVEADLAESWSDKTLGLVDIGATVTNLGVISNGTFSMTRAIPAGGQVLTDALKSYFKLSEEDAESGKSQLDVRGLMNEHMVAENPPLRVLHTHVDDLVREVRRSINYWQSQQSEGASAKRVDAIILVGGGANLPGIAEYFEHKLGISTVARGLFENPRFIGAHAENDRGIELGVAVGLGMGLSPSKAVVRAPKPAKLSAEPATSTPPRAPKPPKSPKPGKGKTFKVTRQAEETPSEIEANESHEHVEVAAAATVAAELTHQDVPTAFQPKAESVVEEPKVIESATVEKYGSEVAALLATDVSATTSGTADLKPQDASNAFQSNADPVVEENKLNESETIEKYGAEVAALLGSAAAEAPVLSVEPQQVDATGADVAALLEGLYEAPRASQPVEAAPMPQAPQIVAPAAVTSPVPEMDEKAALLGSPVATPAPVKATVAKPEKTSVFARFSKGEKSGGPKEKKLKETKAPRAEKLSKPAKEPKQAKPVKVREAKDPEASGIKSKLGAAVSWMFGSPPKEHVKPTGQLAPKTATALTPEPAQAAPRIELLKGEDLQPIDSTLRDAKPAATKNPPAPRVLEDSAQEAKPRARKAPATKKLQSSEASKAPKKEAA